jgi:hypothetical protein
MDSIITEIQSAEFNKGATNLANFYNNKLRPKIEQLYTDYENLNFKDVDPLKTKREEYDVAVKATYLFNRVCLVELHNQGFNETIHNLFLFTNAHINRLQNNCFSITYHTQQKNSEKALCFARKIAIVSFFLAIISIIFTCYYGKNPTPCTCCSVEQSQTKAPQTITEKDSSKIENKALPLFDTINESKLHREH